MNIPTSLEAIVVIVLVFIPGYMFLQFISHSVAFLPKEVDARYFFALIVWGGVIHATGAPLTIPVIDWYTEGTLRDHTLYLVLWAMLLLVLWPIAAGVICSWLITLDRVDNALKKINKDYISRIPSAWDYAIRTGPAFVRVHLSDGTVIGGVYDQHSLADDDGERDLFLETVYNLDENGDFDEVVPASAGVWVPRESISHILFFRQSKEDYDE